MEVRRSIHAAWTFGVDALLFGTSTVAVMFFYIEGQRRIGRTRPAWTDLCLLMPVGIGLSARNSVAVVEGLITRGGEFRRTPKRGSFRGLTERAERLPVAESLLMLYFVMTAAAAIVDSQYSHLPFLSLFLVGYTHAAARGWAERFVASK